MFNFVTDSGQLTRTIAIADDKIISESANFTDIQDNNVRGLFFSGCFYRFAGNFDTFQRFPPNSFNVVSLFKYIINKEILISRTEL